MENDSENDRSKGIDITQDHPLMIIYRLNGLLSFGTLEGEEDQIAKARRILQDEIELNGVPTDERAYHLLLVGGIRERDLYDGVDVSAEALVEFGGRFKPKKYKVIKDSKMNRNSISMISAMMALGGLGGLGRSRGFNIEKSAPTKEQMPLTEEETLKLSQLTGKEKKSFVKELKARHANT